jgi:polar amino acid transport system substrate-binding protein
MNIGRLSRRQLLLRAASAGALACISGRAGAQDLVGKLEKEGKIVIGVHNQWPWGYRTADLKVTGLHPDIVRAVLEPLGLKELDFVVMDFGALIPSLQSRRIDAIASGMAILPSRCKQVSFSEPLQKSGDAVLVKQGNPFAIHGYGDIAANPKFRPADIRGASTTEHALLAGLPRDRVQLFQDINAGVAALLTDRVDGMFMGDGTALGILRDPNVKGIERALPFAAPKDKDGREVANYGAVAFRPEDAAFRDAFNGSLTKIKTNGALLKILQTYGFGEGGVPPDDLTAKDLCGGDYQ